MHDLLMRTVSQGLQAFLPIAFALVWFRRAGAHDAATGLRWGIVAAVPLSVAATYLFQQTTQQALVEAVLAIAALPLAVSFTRDVWQGLPPQVASSAIARRVSVSLAVGAAAALIVARQAMEIGVGLWASVQVRAADPLLAILGGTCVALAASALWPRIGRRLPPVALVAATAVFAAMFTAQLAMYALHESTEARLLPFSEPLHAATEPYGPDGRFGRYVSILLFLAPLGAAALGGRRRAILRPITVSGAIVLVAGVALITATNTERAETAAPDVTDAPAATALAANAPTVPRLLFRHAGVDTNYSRLSSSTLEAGGPAGREVAGLTCERVSFAVGRGICLEADRGIFTTYKAIIFGGAFNPTHTIKLSGSPSRTRVSPDGRVGAITVFVTGQVHRYTGSDFSTRTSIVDMATGDELGELEQFTTWRDGKKFKAADFNFWGVTFARDSNTFYATLATAGTTYLVRGDLGLRKLTVLRDNVECPSLSPDNRLIAFKKKVAKGTAPWRVYILDLTTMTERPVASEVRSIDDQIEWLDGSHVLYGVPRAEQPGSQDVWIAALDSSTAPRIFLPNAESPIVVR